MNFKKNLAMLLCSVLLFSSCGVRTPPDSAGSSGTTSAASGSAAPTSDNLQKTGLPILKEPETFKIMVNKSALCMNTFTEKEIVQQTEKDTNIKFDWIEVPASGYAEKANIMFASGDLPEAFLGGLTPEVISKNIASLMPLNGMVESLAPAVRQLFADRPDIKTSLTHPDGSYYSLPTGDEQLNNMVGGDIWVNTRWLKNVGLEIPTTTDEFHAMLKAFKEQDANGNGDPSDELPFSADQSESRLGSIGQGIDGLFGAFGTYDYPEHVAVKDGKVYFTPAGSNYYEGLKWMSQLFAEKLMDPEIFTMNQDQFNSKFKSADTIGCFIGFSPDMQVGVERMADYTYILPLKGPNGDQTWPLGWSINLGGFAVTQKCKNPGALIRLYDYLTSDLTVALEWTYGKQNSHWEYVEGQKWRIMSENQPKDTPYGEWRQTLSAGPASPVYMHKKWASDLKVLSVPRDILKTDASMAYMSFTPDPKELPPIGFDDAKRNDQRTLMAVEIDNYIKKFKANSVMNGITDADWQKHLDTLKALKVDEYVALWQAFYDAQNQ